MNIPNIDAQKETVAKIIRIFSLCDQLKTKLQSAQTSQCQIAESIVKEVLA